MSDDTQAKKSLGQHWLNDSNALDRICEVSKLTKRDTILEIGPGTGLLTAKLIDQVKKVIAVELDTSLVKILQDKFSTKANFNLINEDILKFNFQNLPKSYKVVANIPYYLTSNLIRKLSETTNPPEQATLLVQKEIAQRMSASPGSMSLLSVTAQYYWDVEPLDIIEAYLFQPPPKVDSQIVKLVKKIQTPLIKPEEEIFFNVVRAGFSQKRKKLLNSLSEGLKLSKNDIEAALRSVSINPNRRAQTLSINEWIRLYQYLLDLLSKAT